MSSIFTRIIRREIPAYVVAEDDEFIAFLDIAPLQPGHTLVVPKTEIDYFFDLDDSQLSRILLFSKRVATAIESVVACQRIGITVIGLEVPHAHLHLVPLQHSGDMEFSRLKLKLSQEYMNDLATKIKSAFK